MCPAQVTTPCEIPAYPVWIQVNPCLLSGTNTSRISSSPITNTGIERPTSTATEEVRSNRLRGLVALMIPTLSPTTSQRTRPPITREMVGGRSCFSIVLTDSPV